MKKLAILVLLLACGQAFSQRVPLSDQSQISIITFGPDQNEIFNAFGHSAIRVVDAAQGMDYFYNYGVFTFDDNFYLNFARGHNYYKLGVYSYPPNRDAYIADNRFIHEQVLALTQEQKQKVVQYLTWNAQPENQTYLYDYFYNNCSTRIRDVFAGLFKGEIQFDGSFIKTNYTIRQLEDRYLNYQPWGDLGINIGLGLPIDKKAAPYEYMYLPDYLESSFDHTSLLVNGTYVPIVKEKVIVYSSRPEKIEKSFFNPWTVFGFVLAITILITARDWKRKNLSAWLDFIFLLITGILGTVLLLLWFATDHHACANNFNLLWALPTNLVACVLIFSKKKPRWLTSYFRSVAIINFLILLTWAMLPQQLNVFLIPLICALTLRYFMNWILGKRSAMN
jgi:hypothetical protein